MPYIAKQDRNKYREILDQIQKIDTKGDLEYCIYFLMKRYMKDKEFRYSTLHDTVYAAIHCGDEYRRRNLDIRENAAMEKNGDIE